MFGQLEANEETRTKLFKELNEIFEPWEGLISRTMFYDEENEVGNVVYLCETRESALIAQERVKRLLEEYAEIAGFTTELFSKVVGQLIIK